MNPRHSNRSDYRMDTADRQGSVLILVLWIALGLVSIALYFAHSMTLELRASDNRTAALQAEQAISGAARYVNYVLTTYGTNGVLPAHGNSILPRSRKVPAPPNRSIVRTPHRRCETAQ